MLKVTLQIYVFLYQNLNTLAWVGEGGNSEIYVFLYQNLNVVERLKEFRSSEFMYFYIRI